MTYIQVTDYQPDTKNGTVISRNLTIPEGNGAFQIGCGSLHTTNRKFHHGNGTADAGNPMLLKQKGRFRREKGTPEAPGGTFRSVRRAVFAGKSAQGCTGAGGVGLECPIELRIPRARVAAACSLPSAPSIRPTLAWASL